MNKYEKELKSQEFLGITKESPLSEKSLKLKALLKSGELKPSGKLLREFMNDKTFSFISSVIEGCYEKKGNEIYGDIDLFYILYEFMLAKYETLKDANYYPDDEETLKNLESTVNNDCFKIKEIEYKDICSLAKTNIKEALSKVLELVYQGIGGTKESRFSKIKDTLSQSEIDECRLAATLNANISDLPKYLNDENPEVAYVARIRMCFDEIYEKYEYEEKLQIEFLEDVIANGMLCLIDANDPESEDLTKIECPFIKPVKVLVKKVIINDPRTLASIIKKGIDDGVIELIEGMDFLKSSKKDAPKLEKKSVLIDKGEQHPQFKKDLRI